MEAEGKIDAEHAIEFLARKRRAILLGGAAVILHGLSRATKDFDIWLDPYPESKVWSEAIEKLLETERSLQALRINSLFPGVWTPIAGSEIAAVGKEDGMIRLVGTDIPLDIFYRPNELEVSDFEKVWERSTPSDRGLRLIGKIDLLVTKQLTGRPTDITDIKFLEDRIEEEYRAKLKDCSEQDAKEMLERFATPEIAAYAIRESGNDKVKQLGWQILEELRAEGNPFAEELSRELKAQRHGLDLRRE